VSAYTYRLIPHFVSNKASLLSTSWRFTYPNIPIITDNHTYRPIILDSRCVGSALAYLHLRTFLSDDRRTNIYTSGGANLHGGFFAGTLTTNPNKPCVQMQSAAAATAGANVSGHSIAGYAENSLGGMMRSQILVNRLKPVSGVELQKVRQICYPENASVHMCVYTYTHTQTHTTRRHTLIHIHFHFFHVLFFHRLLSCTPVHHVRVSVLYGSARMVSYSL
jgi:hypothetical protein